MEVLPVSVVICSRDRPQLLAEAIDSILEGDVRPAELVVVDQSSLPDRDLSGKASKLGIKYVPSRSGGLSRCRNTGVAAAESEIVAFCDDDMLVSRSWLRMLTETLLYHGARTVVTGKVVAGPVERKGAFAASEALGEHERTFIGRLDRDVLAGGNMALFRTTLEDVGLFDERLGPGTPHPAAEDNDLGFRLLEHGYEIRYVPQALAVHRAWRGRWSYPRIRWDYGRGKGGFYAKHATLRDRHILRRAALDIGRRAVRFPRTAIVDRRRAIGDVAYTAGVLAGAARWLLVESTLRGGVRPSSRSPRGDRDAI